MSSAHDPLNAGDTWTELPPEEWTNQEYHDAASWVMGNLAIPETHRDVVMDLLGTHGPEDITAEMVEEMGNL